MAIGHSVGGTVVLVILGIGFFALMLTPGFWKQFWSPCHPRPEQGVVQIMSTRRLLIAYAAIAFILFGSILDLCRDTEHWPWSSYPMYSYAERGETFDDYRLYGVPKNAPNTEIALYNDSRYLEPFDASRLAEALKHSLSKPGLHKGLENCLQRYEQLRRSGEHNGPELSAIRLYHVFWTLDRTGRNIDRPDHKDLIDQVDASSIAHS